MFLDKKVIKKINDKFFYGWLIVGIGGIGIFSSGVGQSHTFSPFIPVISKDLGISGTSITFAYMVATLIAAFLLPKMGKLIDANGAPKMLLISVFFVGIGCFIFGASSNFIVLALAFGFLRFFGQGSLMLGSANLTQQWFDKKRGFALGLMGLGFALSMGFHPPISDFLIDKFGWRYAWVILGFSTWILMIPILIFFAVNKPEDIEVLPDGKKLINKFSEKNIHIYGLTLNEALKEKAFYILSFSFFSIASLVTALHFFQVTILSEHFNITSKIAAGLFVPTMITMILFIPIIGKMLDVLQTHIIISLSLLTTTLSLISITFSSSYLYALTYAIIFGINNAFNLSLFGYIWPRYFGRKHVGSIQGAGQMILVVGASIGAIPFALAMDYNINIIYTIRIIALYPLLAALICYLFLREPIKLSKLKKKY